MRRQQVDVIMAKRPNISPSGWLSNLANQPRQAKSIENRRQEWLKEHWWLCKPHYRTKITQSQLAEATELGVLHLLDPSNRTV